MMISVLFTILLLMQSTTAWLNYSNQVNWGGLCATGKLQSPISLDHVIAKYVAGLQTKFEYPVSVNTRLFNTDSTLKLVIGKNFKF
jgi:carbonic anhydrase